MTDFNAADRDVDVAIRSWLREDRHEDVSRIAGAVLDQVETIPQRRSWWPAWRFHDMNTFAKALVATVAVLAVAFVGINLLPARGGAGPGGQPSPSLTPTPTRSPSAPPTESVSDLPSTDSVEAGTYRLPGSSILITLPSGWDAGEGSIRKHNDQPDELRVGFATSSISVYPDACATEVTPPPVGPTTDDLLAALRAQENSDVSEPVAVTVGEVAATRVEISVPEGLDLATCREGMLRALNAVGYGWVAWGLEPTGSYKPWAIYVAEVPSGRVVFDFGHETDATDADIAELNAIVESMKTEPAP
jgi:hypothetical protein